MVMPMIAAASVVFAVSLFLYESSIRMLHFYGTVDTSYGGYLLIFFKSSFFMLYTVSSIVCPAGMQLLFFQNTMEKLEEILRL